MTFTIGFDATAAVRQTAGIGRYTRELLRALSLRNDDVSYRGYFCGGGDALQGSLPLLDERFRLTKIPLSDRIMNAVWFRAHVPFPVQAFTGHFDVFHSPDFTLPPTLLKPSVLTIHDLAFLTVPECAYPTLAVYLRKVVPRSIRRATHIVAVSECTKRDLMRLLDVPEEKITVVLEGVDARFRPPCDRSDALQIVRKLGILTAFILAVGTLEPRKNYLRLFEAYALLRERGIRHPLIIAGRPGWLYQPILRRMEELNLTEFVTFVQPDDSELAALYGVADAFVFPSLYEGFGIPPLEALACGAPVACSRASSLPEVVGKAAVLFDPLDTESIADSLFSILTDPHLVSSLRLLGPAQAAHFSWAVAAETTSRLYREVANRD